MNWLGLWACTSQYNKRVAKQYGFGVHKYKVTQFIDIERGYSKVSEKD